MEYFGSLPRVISPFKTSDRYHEVFSSVGHPNRSNHLECHAFANSDDLLSFRDCLALGLGALVGHCFSRGSLEILRSAGEAL